MLKICSFIGILAATPIYAGTMPPQPVYGPIHVIDGDTIRLASGETVRIYNIDAPETHKPRCKAEKLAGESATPYLRSVLSAGGVMISRCEPATSRCKDRYGRTLATLSTRNVVDVGDAMVGIGLAMPWKPGREAKNARIEWWCKEPID